MKDPCLPPTRYINTYNLLTLRCFENKPELGTLHLGARIQHRWIVAQLPGRNCQFRERGDPCALSEQHHHLIRDVSKYCEHTQTARTHNFGSRIIHTSMIGHQLYVSPQESGRVLRDQSLHFPVFRYTRIIDLHQRSLVTQRHYILYEKQETTF